MFEQASRRKFRFDTIKGKVTVEDLWDMPLTSRDGFDLDAVAIALSHQVEEVKSFVNNKRPDDLAKSKLDLVVHVIQVKLKEAATREQVIANKEKRDKILSILEDKQDESLRNMNEDDLKKQLAALEGG